MKRLSPQLILLVCFIPCCSTIIAQQAEWKENNSTSIAKHTCRFVYPHGSAEIRSGFGNNADVLSQLDTFIQSAVDQSGLHIYRIFFTAYSSIDGAYSVNERLAYNRVESFRDYINIRYPELNRYPVDMVWVAEDWGELSRLVRRSNINEREEILEIIRKVPNFDDREELLMKLNGGRAYFELQETILPQLCRVEIKIEFTSLPAESKTVEIIQPVAPPVQKQEVLPVKTEPMSNKDITDWLGIRQVRTQASARPAVTPAQQETAFTQKEKGAQPVVTPAQKEPVQKETPQVPSSAMGNEVKDLSNSRSTVTEQGPDGVRNDGGRAPRFALKTNLLLWAGVQSDFSYTAPVANGALEYFITPGWSVELGAMYSYWRYNNNHEFQGMSGYWLEPKYALTFRGDRLGIYVGLYGRAGDYDRMTIDKSVASPGGTLNYTGNYWDAGLSAGVRVDLIGGLGLEIGARAGYVSTNAVKYTRDNLYNWYAGEQKYNKFKVTDINLNLVYRFR